jgi:hypothetical protein
MISYVGCLLCKYLVLIIWVIDVLIIFKILVVKFAQKL